MENNDVYKYLTLKYTDKKDKGMTEKYREIWNKIKYPAYYDFDAYYVASNYIKTKINSDDDLP